MKKILTKIDKFNLLILIGVLVRIFLIYELPLWGDEAFTIWASHEPLSKILTYVTDPVHPPGYYLFIKVWGLVSNHLFWLRLSSFFALLINIKLINEIFKENKKFAQVLTFLYVFSGYFLTFDWQLRMYTPSLTFILASLLFQKQNKKIPLLITNIFGYFFDYAFAWYGLSFTFFRSIIELIENKKISKINKYNIASTLVFLTCIFMNPGLIISGEKGIDWAIKYYTPLFHIPYFFGAHLIPLLSNFFIILCIHGLFHITEEEKNNIIIKTLIIGSSFLYSSTLVVSVLQILKIFHIRSLNIIPFMFIVVMAKSLEFFWQKNKKIFFLISMIYLINFIGAVTIHLSYHNDKPGKLIVHFFPWKNYFNKLSKDQDSNQKYISIKNREGIAYLYVWSFLYSAEGKETLGAKKIDVKIEQNKNLADCKKIEVINQYWQPYLCPKNP